MEESRCVNCDAVLYEPIGEPREPCPLCKDTRRRFDVVLRESLGFYEHTRIKGNQSGSNQIAFDSRRSASSYRQGRIWHHFVRPIDNDNNSYVETIPLLETRELVLPVSKTRT